MSSQRHSTHEKDKKKVENDKDDQSFSQTAGRKSGHLYSFMSDRIKSVKGKSVTKSSREQAEEIWKNEVQPLLAKGERVFLLYSANNNEAEKLIAARRTGRLKGAINGQGQALIFAVLAKKIEQQNLQNQVMILPIATSLKGGSNQNNNQVTHKHLNRDLSAVARYLGAGFVGLGLLKQIDNTQKEFAIGGGFTHWLKKVTVTINGSSITQHDFIQKSLEYLSKNDEALKSSKVEDTANDFNSDNLDRQKALGQRYGIDFIRVSPDYSKYPNLLIDFFEGKTPIRVTKQMYSWWEPANQPCLTFDELLASTDLELERYHTYIQRWFPTIHPSVADKDAPVLTLGSELNEYLKQHPEKQLAATQRMLKFYGLNLTQNNGKYAITLADNFSVRAKVWITPDNHNYKRLDRMIKSLKANGNAQLADEIALTLIKISNMDEYKNAMVTKSGQSERDYFVGAYNSQKEDKDMLQKAEEIKFTDQELEGLKKKSKTSDTAAQEGTSTSLVGALKEDNLDIENLLKTYLSKNKEDDIIKKKYSLMKIAFQLYQQTNNYLNARQERKGFLSENNKAWAKKLNQKAEEVWDELAGLKDNNSLSDKDIIKSYEKLQKEIQLAGAHHHKSTLNFWGVTVSQLKVGIINKFAEELKSYEKTHAPNVTPQKRN